MKNTQADKSIRTKTVKTPRLEVFVRTSGDLKNTPLLLLHGNASSSVFWEELMRELASDFYCIAPDLRGYGDTEDLCIDARQGTLDFVEDLEALLEVFQVSYYHLMAHSLGGAIAYRLMIAAKERILSTTLVNPCSPFGFGGTKDEKGTPCFPDFSGSGGGTVNPEFARLLKEKDRSAMHPQASPRVVMNNFYWKPPFVPAREEELLTGLLKQKVGNQKYPGDFSASSNYPFVIPGIFGPVNAISPRYIGESVNQLIELTYKAPVLWVRGRHDLIVSDRSLLDMGTLGQMGLLPDYPGEAIYPPQPMVAQTRCVLNEYRKVGGSFREIVMEEAGHTPFIEQPVVFLQHLKDFYNSIK